MYCINCCLCFPIRGGGMLMSGLCLVINIIGAAFFFLWGSYFFSSILSIFFGGFSAIQAVMAILGLFALCNTSYMLTRAFVYTQWLFTFLSVARIGVAAFILQQNRDWIQGECSGGVNDKGYSPQGTAAAFYCDTPIDRFILIFIIGMVVDWVFNGYLYFILWRYYLLMREYPDTIKVQEFTDEEALDEL